MKESENRGVDGNIQVYKQKLKERKSMDEILCGFLAHLISSPSLRPAVSRDRILDDLSMISGVV